jgi:putative two-component system response regulator
MYIVILDDAELNNLLMTQALHSVPGSKPLAFTQPEKALAFVEAKRTEIGVAIVWLRIPPIAPSRFARSEISTAFHG